MSRGASVRGVWTFLLPAAQNTLNIGGREYLQKDIYSPAWVWLFDGPLNPCWHKNIILHCLSAAEMASGLMETLCKFCFWENLLFEIRFIFVCVRTVFSFRFEYFWTKKNGSHESVGTCPSCLWAKSYINTARLWSFFFFFVRYFRLGPKCRRAGGRCIQQAEIKQDSNTENKGDRPASMQGKTRPCTQTWPDETQKRPGKSNSK